MGYEDAEEFWRSEFTQKVDEERFNKEYLYYIKHLYGLVGGRKSYEPRSCQQLIKGLDQHYGCPFKMYDNERLNQKCISQGFSKEGNFCVSIQTENNIFVIFRHTGNS